LLAETSDKIERLIWWPFVVAGLLILARFGGFDLWTYPWPFVVIVVIILLAVLLASLRLRKGASLAKEAAVRLLEDKRIELLGKSAADQRQAGQIAEAISRIEGIRGGALRRLSEHPVLLALTIPFGGGFFAYLDMLR
jgi:hypothetical protein